MRDYERLCFSDDQCHEYMNDPEFESDVVCGSTWEKAGLAPVKYDDVRNNSIILYGIPGFDNFFQALYTVY